MADRDDDLDLLLSLQERVLETPPGSPTTSSGCLSDDDNTFKHGKQSNLSAFKEIVQDCLESDPIPSKRPSKKSSSEEPFIEKNSGLRLRNLTVSKAELYERLAGIRFLRLSSIKNMLMGDTLTGCWATVGVLVEKGNQRTSKAGKSYCIWKIGCLEENTVSLFLFGSAYEQNKNAPAGTALALFSCNVRKDNVGEKFSLSAYSSNQVLKMGSSSDYGVCNGIRKDKTPCTTVINKRRGGFCKYHKTKTTEQYSSIRMELMGGNLKTAFRDKLQSRSVHVLEPLSDWRSSNNYKKPATVLSVGALKKALSKAEQMTTNAHSQGIRLLNEFTADKENREDKKRASDSLAEHKSGMHKRVTPNPETVLLRQNKNTKMIEIEIFNSDEEI